MGTEGPDRERGGWDWVEALTRLAGALGLNEVRVRWKLEALRKRAEAARFRAGEQVEHVRYQHKICPECGRLNDGEAERCARCGTRLGGKAWHVLQRIGLQVPSALSMTALLGAAMVVVYGRVLLASGSTGLEGVMSLPVGTLLHFGGNWSLATLGGLELWRLGTSVFLHAGLWHIGFNLLALSQLGPPMEEIYGRGRMLFFFMLTGLLASLASAAAGGLLSLFLTGSLAGFGGGVSIGASGALMGLTGMTAGWGQRDGTGKGRAVRNQMLRWGLITIVFGLFIGADNVAHVVGFLAGGVVGLALPSRVLQRSRSLPATVVETGLGGLLALAAVGLCLLPPPSPADRVMARMSRVADGQASMDAEFRRACAALEDGTLDSLPWYEVPSTPTFGFTRRQRRAFLGQMCEAQRQERLCEAFRSRGVDAAVEEGRRLLPTFDPDERARARLEETFRRRCPEPPPGAVSP